MRSTVDGRGAWKPPPASGAARWSSASPTRKSPNRSRVTGSRAAPPPPVLAALREDAAPLDDPLIRFQGRKAPEGGEAELRTAWNALVAETITPAEQVAATEFGYTDFGPAGAAA